MKPPQIHRKGNPAKSRMQLSTKLLPNGRLRTARTTTSNGHVLTQDEIADGLRRELEREQIIKYSKKKIREIFTEEYVDNLLARAALSRGASSREFITAEQLGRSEL